MILFLPVYPRARLNSTHTCFRSTAHHPDQVDIRNHARDQFSHFYFQFSGCAIRSGQGSSFLDGIHDMLMGMAQDHRSPGGDIINVFISIGII